MRLSMRTVSAVVIVGTILASSLAVACGRDREAPQASAPAPASPPPSSAPATASEVAGLLPAPGAVAGWSRTREPQVYGPGNLWEFINGAAETYLAFGVQEAASAGYKNANGLEATIDVFRMADPVNAFGIFRHESSPAAEPLAVGTEGYSAANVVNFWKGRDYVKVTALGDGAGILLAIQALADLVAASIPDSAELPREVAFFPPSNQLPRSVKYVPKDFAGQSYLERVFEAEYQDGKRTMKLAIAAFETPEAAVEALGRFKAFIQASGKVRSDIAKPGDGGFVGDENYYGRVVAVRSGSRIVFALGAESDAAGVALVEEFLARAAG